uniref:Uncharacterized protein n=1 Tax=Tetranychus urticae TaxID=32264 RepID=T1KMM0_TETUR
MKIGIAEYSISDGITLRISKFTYPGNTPVGMARIVREHAKNHDIEASDLTSEAIGFTMDFCTGEYDFGKKKTGIRRLSL